ncbi:putative stress-induced protein KIN1/KIN2 [Helianthus annuus]|nr:putative stress-induced protein KIN1/KIN2 [Helianthus annuus]KAJ0909170.1 putative stress-induced protein KIN1/KIN2 [Helianthus annuus]
MNNSQSAEHQAGQAQATVEGKTNQLMEKASNAAHSAHESMQQSEFLSNAGQQMKEKKNELTEEVKRATGY